MEGGGPGHRVEVSEIMEDACAQTEVWGRKHWDHRCPRGLEDRDVRMHKHFVWQEEDVCAEAKMSTSITEKTWGVSSLPCPFYKGQGSTI